MKCVTWNVYFTTNMTQCLSPVLVASTLNECGRWSTDTSIRILHINHVKEQHLNPTCHTHFYMFYHTHFYMFYHTHFHMFYHTHFHTFQIGVGTIRESNYPLAVLCQYLGLITLLAAVLWIAEGGWWGGPFQAFWSSWVEHHARLVQGLWNWQVWAASPPATFVLHLEFRVQFWLLHSCVQFAVSADWEAQGKRVPSP